MYSILEPWRDGRIIYHLYLCDPKDLEIEPSDPSLPDYLMRWGAVKAKGVRMYTTDVHEKMAAMFGETAKQAVYGLAMLDGWSLRDSVSYLETIYYRCDDEAEVIEEGN